MLISVPERYLCASFGQMFTEIFEACEDKVQVNFILVWFVESSCVRMLNAYQQSWFYIYSRRYHLSSQDNQVLARIYTC